MGQVILKVAVEKVEFRGRGHSGRGIYSFVRDDGRGVEGLEARVYEK